MTWALKRQIIYIIILLLIVVVFGSLIVLPYFKKEPTCFDLRQNGGEVGVDCGGSCLKACTFEGKKVSVLWARAFRVLPGRYNAVAYVENQNKDNVARKINYRFRFADENNVYIGKREGSTYIPANQRFAVFEPAVDTGNSTPVYTTLEFTSEPDWLNVEENKLDALKISVSEISLLNEKTSPVLSAKLQNKSLFDIPDISVVAILYDKSGNAVNASRSVVDVLPAGGSTDVVFTWREPFSEEIVAKEIISAFDIFSVKLK